MSKKVAKQDTAAPAVVFQEKAIRRTMHNNEWWFVITDIIAALTDSADPSGLLEEDAQTRSRIWAKPSKGGGNLSPPLPWSLPRPADLRNSSAGTPKASSA